MEFMNWCFIIENIMQTLGFLMGWDFLWLFWNR